MSNVPQHLLIDPALFDLPPCPELEMYERQRVAAVRFYKTYERNPPPPVGDPDAYALWVAFHPRTLMAIPPRLPAEYDYYS